MSIGEHANEVEERGGHVAWHPVHSGAVCADVDAGHQDIVYSVDAQETSQGP